MTTRQRANKTALVLAGGGLTGAVYEIGALRAIDELLEDRTVNDFDIYVGTSAGALVASFIANGLSPEEMLQVIDDTHPSAQTIERKHLFNLDWQYYLKWGLKLPGKLLEVGADYLLNLSDTTFFDLLWSLSNALPAGLYDPSGLERFVREGLRELGLSNNFEEVRRQLYVIATDLDNGERAVFGRGYLDAPISQSVAASSAMPMVYKPVRIGGKEFIDGGTRGNASIDLAIEQGATLVVCINPLVPFVNPGQDDEENAPFSNGNENGGHLSEKGVQFIANQVFRIMLHSGLQYHIKQLRRAHPEVDIILIEPKPEDYKMFFYNIMRYSARLLVARHGFESVTLDLAKDYHQYREILSRHGVSINRSRVIEELAEIAQSQNDPAVVRGVLEARSVHCGKRKRFTPMCELDRSLDELELALNSLSVELAVPSQ